VEFQSFEKISRLTRGCTVTEKLDGSNGQVAIFDVRDCDSFATGYIAKVGGHLIYAGSRNKWVTPEDDNYGFARWVKEHIDELALLGPGRHFGEWWGSGIQRRYGMKEKVFSLFNVGRWNEQNPPPACCRVVPVIYEGVFSDTAVEGAISKLKEHGSYAAPGFMDPEGVVVYHQASRTLFKKTIKNDEAPKGQQ
jgi:hypothetical protein